MTTCTIVVAVGGPETPALTDLQNALEARLWFSPWAIPARAVAVTYPPEDVCEPIDELNRSIKNQNAWLATRKADPNAAPPKAEVLNGRNNKHFSFDWPHLMLYSSATRCIICYELDARPNAIDGKLPLIPPAAVRRVTMVYWDMPPHVNA